MVNLSLSHYLSPSQPGGPVSGLISSPMEKRYLKDYPESDKIYNPKYCITQVKDLSGYILCVPDAIKDRLVLEAPFEPKLQQLARKYSLGLAGPERNSLYNQIVAEFGSKEATEAVLAAFAEKRALHSPETREWSDRMVEVIKLRTLANKEIDKVNQQWDMVSYIGPDGLRRLNKELTVFEVFKYGKLMLSDYLEKNHPTALTRLKVALVVLPFFFYTCASDHFFGLSFVN